MGTPSAVPNSRLPLKQCCTPLLQEGARELSRQGYATAAANAGGAQAFSRLAIEARLAKYGEEGVREQNRLGHAKAAEKVMSHIGL